MHACLQILVITAPFLFLLIHSQTNVELAETEASFQWSEPIALQYVYYSYAAYCNATKVASWDCKWCHEPQIADFVPTASPYDAQIDGYGYVGYHPKNNTS